MSALVQAGFEILVEAGYRPEMADFECLHELKFIVDLMHREGIRGMRARISERAKWGDISVGPKIVDASVRARMREVLGEIQRGKFANDWLRETATGGNVINGCWMSRPGSRTKRSANAFAIGCLGSPKNPRTFESAAEAAPGLRRNNMFRALPNE